MTTDENSETPGPETLRRRPWLRRAMWAGLATVFILALGIFFSGTNMAFQRLWFPLAEKVTGTKIGATTASFSFAGNIQVINLRYEDSAMGINAKINHAEISFSPRSLVVGPRPRLILVEIMEIDVVIDEPAEDAEPEMPEAPELPETLLPVAIEQLTLSNVAVTLRRDGIRIMVPTLTLADLEPGGETKMSFRALADYSPSDGDADYYLARFNGDLVLKISDDAEAIHADGDTNFSVKATPRVNGTVSHDTGIAPPRRGVTGSLAETFGLDLTPTSVRFSGQGEAPEIVLTDPSFPDPSPPLAFNMNTEGEFAPGERRISLNVLAGKLSQAGTDLFRVTLNESIELKLPEESSGNTTKKTPAADSPSPGNEIDPPAAQVYAQFGPVTVDDLRPWGNFIGVESLDAVESGRLEANASVGVTPKGDFIRGSGEFKGSDVNFSFEEAASPIGPFAADANFSFSAKDLEVFALNTLELRAKLDEREFIVLNASGNYDADKESAHLAAHFRLEEPLRTAEAFDIYEEPRGYRVDGASTEIDLRLDRASGEAPSLLNVAIRTEAARIENPEGMIHESAMTANIVGQVDADWRKVTGFRASAALLDDAQTTTGMLSATGHWALASEDDSASTDRPVSASTQTGRIEGEIDNFNLRPWLEILGAKTEGTEDEWPERSRFTIYPLGDEIVFEGEHRIGPILVPEKDAAP